MSFQISEFGLRYGGHTGTRLLMDDLGEVLASGRAMCNLGGGNPARIPAMQALFRQLLEQQLTDDTFTRLSGSYDGPQGYRPFLVAVAQLLRRTYGWQVGPENVLMTAGSQASFYMLFNLFAGAFPDGSQRYLQLPMTPEYIGYADIARDPDTVRSVRPTIEIQENHRFKYRVDFAQLAPGAETGAVCVSRPTNPTGNVISRDELQALSDLSRRLGVPLIIDNAYGLPFPNILFADAEPWFDEHVIYTMSLSKLGLPGLRTGIVVASAEIVELMQSMNAVMTLASGSLGASLVTSLFESGEVLRLSRDVIQPYYRERLGQALAWCQASFEGLDYYVHQPEGAIFLWLWFPNLPISAKALYERLKRRDVLVIPGHYFFPGLAESWQHAEECIRISYAQTPAEVEAGIRIIADEVRRVRDEHR